MPCHIHLFPRKAGWTRFPPSSRANGSGTSPTRLLQAPSSTRQQSRSCLKQNSAQQAVRSGHGRRSRAPARACRDEPSTGHSQLLHCVQFTTVIYKQHKKGVSNEREGTLNGGSRNSSELRGRCKRCHLQGLEGASSQSVQSGAGMLLWAASGGLPNRKRIKSGSSDGSVAEKLAGRADRGVSMGEKEGGRGVGHHHLN